MGEDFSFSDVATGKMHLCLETERSRGRLPGKKRQRGVGENGPLGLRTSPGQLMSEYTHEARVWQPSSHGQKVVRWHYASTRKEGEQKALWKTARKQGLSLV